MCFIQIVEQDHFPFSKWRRIIFRLTLLKLSHNFQESPLPEKVDEEAALDWKPRNLANNPEEFSDKDEDLENLLVNQGKEAENENAVVVPQAVHMVAKEKRNVVGNLANEEESINDEERINGVHDDEENQ